MVLFKAATLEAVKLFLHVPFQELFGQPTERFVTFNGLEPTLIRTISLLDSQSQAGALPELQVPLPVTQASTNMLSISKQVVGVWLKAFKLTRENKRICKPVTKLDEGVTKYLGNKTFNAQV
jgi:hypothetical protein